MQALYGAWQAGSPPRASPRQQVQHRGAVPGGVPWPSAVLPTGIQPLTTRQTSVDNGAVPDQVAGRQRAYHRTEDLGSSPHHRKTPEGTRKVLQVVVERPGGKPPLVAQW